MIKLEIIILTNNVVLPFQNLREEYGLKFIELNRLFATHSIAEHGLGFLINIYDVESMNNNSNDKLLKKIIFDTGGPNQTFIHNLDLHSYPLYDVDELVLSHWHYDHTGGLYKILERIEKRIPVICHKDSKFERFFKRSIDIKNEDLIGNTRKKISSFLAESKIVNQVPINVNLIKKLNGDLIFSEKAYELFNQNGLKITASGEIPRIYQDEQFDNMIFLKDGFLKIDEIKDDKCLIVELSERIILLCGCCHSGLKNTLDYVKRFTKKRITHIIGGIHMAGASEERINSTISYLNDFQDGDSPLYLFPIHCSGERILNEINNKRIPTIHAFNSSVGTVFTFY